MITPHACRRTLAVLATALSTASAFADVPISQKFCTVLDVPVAGVTNRAYLTSLSSRPWWNRDWTRRAPILVSTESDVAEPKAIVDAIVDFGEEVRPEDVRVVTPWETEVACVAERVQSSKVRLIFQTPLRVHENKPFLVYWGRKNGTVAGASSPRDGNHPTTVDLDLKTQPHSHSPLTLTETAKEIRILNGVLDVVIDRKHVTGGFLRKVRVIGSDAPNELLERATGWAWNGLVMNFDNSDDWSDGAVVCDNPFVKSVRFTQSKGSVTLSVYADQPRIDWSYEMTNANQCVLGVSWAVGGGVAYDDFFYPGSSGKTLTFRAALDGTTDCMQPPRLEMGPFFGAGWFAIASKRCADVCGIIFDRPTLSGFWYNASGQDSGEWTRLTFRHGGRHADVKRGSGSIVALAGKPLDVEREYLRRKAPLSVFVGAAEPYAEHPLVRPRLDHDFIADINCGKGCGHGWNAGMPLPDPMWATNIINHLRSYGVTGIRIGGYGWTDMPITEPLYRELEKAINSDLIDKQYRKDLTGWQPGKYTGRDFLEISHVAHAKGLVVKHCGAAIYGTWGREFSQKFDAEFQRIALDLNILMANCDALDVSYNDFEGQEQVIIPEDVKKSKGNDYWNWKDPNEFFAWQEKSRALCRRYYEMSKKARPDLPVLFYNSENGELGREMFMSEQIGSMDTIVVEMLHGLDFSRCKHVAKRMRALFDNEPGRTVHHHYYFMQPNAIHRIKEIELPFVCGVNGFSHENQSYENYTRELSEIAADFYRFAEYTELGKKAARMAPVRYLGVFRDSECYREDIRKGRYGLPKDRPYYNRAEQDGRCRALGEIRNLDFDFVMNPFFTAKALAKYRIVYIPEDDVFSEKLAKELVAYVKAGGTAIVEGVMGGDRGGDAPATTAGTVAGASSPRGAGIKILSSLNLAPDTPTPLGKGKIVWFREVRTDKLARRDQKTINEVAKMIETLAGPMPHKIAGAPSLDGVLQSGPDGMLLSIHNTSDRPETGRVTFGDSLDLDLKTRPLFVLDVKTGVRFALTNGFDVTVAPRQCGFYLIGGETFTAVPKSTAATVLTPAIATVAPAGTKVQSLQDKAFVPTKVVEFTRGDRKGNPIKITRSKETFLDVTALTPANYFPPNAKKAIAAAKFVHFAKLSDIGAKDAAVYDDVFTDCADELKALLKRGGAILFDMSATGPKARAFLKEVGVFDPNEHLAPSLSDNRADWVTATNHPVAQAVLAKKRGFGLSQYDRSFLKWDAEKQVAPVRARRNRDAATLVLQDNVLGAGKVIFAENQFLYNDWYENRVLGDALYAWILGIPVEDHIKKARQYLGGVGDPLAEHP